MKKNIALLIIFAMAWACGGSDKLLTDEARVTALFNEYFSDRALDCSIASITCVDTLFERMPETDPVFLGYLAKHDSIVRSSYYAARNYLDSAALYKRSYRGRIESYLYRAVVKSDQYDLKLDVESYLYQVDSAMTSLRQVPADYLERVQDIYEMEEFMLYWNH